jgi:hypothetical protein
MGPPWNGLGFPGPMCGAPGVGGDRAGTATHDAGGLPHGSSYFLGQPWLRPRGPEEAQGAAQQRRCPVKYKPPPGPVFPPVPPATSRARARAAAQQLPSCCAVGSNSSSRFADFLCCSL